MNYKWFGLFAFALSVLFFGLASPGTPSTAEDVFAFLLVFAGVPYLIYKSFPSKTGLYLALASPLLIGPLCGYWGKFLVERRLDKEGITTDAIVFSAWNMQTRYGGKVPLFQAKFQDGSSTYKTSSYDNKHHLQKGDTVKVRYAASNPEVNSIIGASQ